MSERFLKYETTNTDLPVDERGVLTAAGGGKKTLYLNCIGGEGPVTIIGDPVDGISNIAEDGMTVYKKWMAGTLEIRVCTAVTLGGGGSNVYSDVIGMSLDAADSGGDTCNIKINIICGSEIKSVTIARSIPVNNN